MPIATHVLVLFDGLCEPTNPGGTGCFGFSVRGLTGPIEPVYGSGALAPLEKAPMTNNYAEYAALGRALGLIAARFKADVGPATRLTICGDSQLVINQLKGEWKCEAPVLVPLLHAIREKLALLGCQWDAQWIPREQNVEADRLARSAYVGRVGALPPERQK